MVSSYFALLQRRGICLTVFLLCGANALRHHRHNATGTKHTIYSTDSQYLGHIEVDEQRQADGAYLRTFMTDNVAQSEASFRCKGQDAEGHGTDCTLDNTPSPLERAYLRNTLIPTLAFSNGMSWSGGDSPTGDRGPETHLAVLGFGAGTLPMYALEHIKQTHISAVDIDPAVYEVAFNFFGVPLPIHEPMYSAMRDKPSNPSNPQRIDHRCTHDKQLCVQVDDGLSYLKGMPANSIDILVVDCMGGSGEAPPWLNPKSGLTELVQHARRTSQVVLVDQASLGDGSDPTVEIWKKGGFDRVMTFGFDDTDLAAVRTALCPGGDCGKWNRFLLAMSSSSGALKDWEALPKAKQLDQLLNMGAEKKVSEIVANR